MKGDWDRLLGRVPLLSGRRWLAYAIAIALSGVAAAVRAWLDPVFPPGFPFLTFFPAVIVSSFLYGRGPGTLAAILCGLLAWFFFIPPVGSFALDVATAVALGFYLGVVAVDIALIHWMQRANARLRDERERSRQLAVESAALAERNELLFHELQHRVANNIQMVGAVLGLQRRGIADPAARHSIDEAANRVQLIGRIQRQLYDLGGAPAAPAAFLRDLAHDLAEASGKPGISYALDADPDITLPPDAMIPLALIMAEAMANAIEHGFADRDTGHVAIALTRTEAGLGLRIEDDGAGLPPGFDSSTATSLGLKIANTLARQLGGEFRVEPARGGGTATSLTIAG